MTTKTLTLRSPTHEKKMSLKSGSLKSPTVIPNQKSVEKSIRPLISPSSGELQKKFSMPQMSPRIESLLNSGVVTTRNNVQRMPVHHASTASLTSKEQYELREQNTNMMVNSPNPSRIYSSPKTDEKGKVQEKLKISQPIPYSPGKQMTITSTKSHRDRNIT